MALLISRGQRPSFRFTPTQFAQGQSRTVPGPYGGLNLRDDITALEPNQARVLDNWRARSGNLVLREGSTEWATSVGAGEVPTIAAFVGLTSSKVLAASDGGIYDATSSGSATSLATGFSNNRWQTALYNNRLQFVNGTDAPQVYDGSTVGAAGWSGSGLTATNLINVAPVRNRLWFCEKNSADVWYGGIGSITGTLTKFQLSQIATGGICIAIGSWSRDAGDGADDATVFVMSTGEIIVYQGDPATTFELSGKFPSAPPIGRNCLFKVGGELVILTRLGVLPVSAAVGGVALDLARIDPWGKIAPGFAADVNLYGDTTGWHGVLHDGSVYINVPQVAGTVSKQWVLDTRIGAWSTQSGWPCSSLCSLNSTLYMGGFDGKVRYIGGATDDGTLITARASGAFTAPTASQSTNLFTAVRPKVKVSGPVSGIVGVDTDYILLPYLGAFVEINNGADSTPWGSPWGSPWGASSKADPTWYSITGEGRSVSVRFQVTASANDIEWFASDIAFKPGGIR